MQCTLCRQNELVELWAVLDWANPGCLGGRRRFQETFAAVLERGRRRGAPRREVAEAGRRRELLATLRQRWLLRRTKAAISDQLPNKTDQVPASPAQTRLHGTEARRGPSPSLCCNVSPQLLSCEMVIDSSSFFFCSPNAET